MRIRHARRADSSRRGAAVAEFALCLPVIVLLVFAPIELCEMLHRRTGLAVAAYEGARRSLRRSSTSADVIQSCRDVLNARGLSAATVEVGPYEVLDAPVGTPIVVTVSLPRGTAGGLTLSFVPDRDLKVRAVMIKEWK